MRDTDTATKNDLHLVVNTTKTSMIKLKFFFFKKT